MRKTTKAELKDCDKRKLQAQELEDLCKQVSNKAKARGLDEAVLEQLLRK